MRSIFALLLCVTFATLVDAMNPEQVAAGKQLFVQEFSPTQPGLRGDGLGPVFNDTSCVACHNAGGIGGSGDARNNARSLGMREAALLRKGDRSALTSAIAEFSPGFISASGGVQSAFSLHRRGGSPAFSKLRDASMRYFNAQWNEDAKLSSDTVHAERSPQRLVNSTGDLAMTVQVFARNTTALFGSGLIDQVPESALIEQARLQQRDREISGRPATLADGRLGKFGWRANFATLLEFTENACAAELGLQSSRVRQPGDLTNPSYVNSNPDLSDDAIISMNAFVASLPRPQREVPSDSRQRQRVATGEARFATIGCATCHVPNLGNIEGLYSDLLLHDTGPYSVDLAGAPPFRKDVVFSEEITSLTATHVGYYGPVQEMQFSEKPTVISAIVGRENPYLSAPSTAPKTVVEPLGRLRTVRRNLDDLGWLGTALRVAARNRNMRSSPTAEAALNFQMVSTSNIEPTYVNQEWRTPPLWGVRESAPYMHDGRAETILEAIAMHDGESRGTRNRFFALPYEDQQSILEFLDTLVAPTQGVTPAPRKFTDLDLVKR